VSDIGMYGCYLDTPNAPPVGAQIVVKIFKGTDFFETAATVAYSQSNKGMGLKFRDVSRHFLPILQKWLLEAMRAAQA